MSFANPILLLALLGALVPILIHLIHKRRPRKQPFAAIELVLKSVERVERRWRLKRFLLLAARVLLLATLAVAAAGPLIGKESSIALTATGPQRLAVVVDASLSMHARHGKRTSFERAVTAARNLVDAMGPEDQAVIVAARSSPELVTERPTGSRPQLYAALAKLQPGYDHADLGVAASFAAQALGSLSRTDRQEEPAPAEGAPSIAARVVVLSDLAEHGYQTVADLTVPGSSRPASLEILDVLSEIEPEVRVNRAITAVSARNVPGRAPRSVEIRARVQSFRHETKTQTEPLDITLKSAGDTLVSGSVDVLAGTVVDKVLRHAFARPGHVPVVIELEPDALAEDDVRFAYVDVRRQVRILIVDGAPSGVPKEDEVFYLERALQTGAADQPPPRIINTDDLPRVDFSAFDVVILAGVSTLGRSDGARLVEFVERGGGLLITASEDLDVELYNTELAQVLPRPLRGLKVVDPESGGLGSTGIVTMSKPRLDHPVLEIFEGEALGGLLSTRSRAYLLLQPGGVRPMQVLVEHDDGQPALIESEAGQGRVVVLTTSIDRDMTDLPIRPAFVPLMRRLVLRLGNALSQPDERHTLVEQVREIRVPPRATRLMVTDPAGVESELTLAGVRPGETVRFADTHLPGHYRVSVAYAGAFEPWDAESFAVNPDTLESDLRPISTDEAEAILLGARPEAGRSADSMIARARALSGGLSPEALAGLLLLLMGLAFLVESALTAQRIGR